MKKFTSINNVASFKNGFAFKSKNYTTEGIRIIRISNVQDGKIIDKNPKFYPENSTKDYSEYLLEDGDLLMSLTGDVGRVGFIKSELLPAYLNQRVLKIECDEKVILKKYIFYFFKSPEIYQKIIAMSKGVAQLNVSAADIFQLKIPVPSLQEQEKIVEKLDKLFENIDKNQEQILNLKFLYSQIKDSFINKKLSNEKTQVLSSFSDIQYGYTPDKNSKEKIQVPILRITDIQNNKVDWENVPNVKVSQETFDKFYLKKGDILFARTGGTLGKSYLFNEDKKAIFASYLIRVTNTKSDFNPKFLKYFFESTEYWKQVNQGTIGAAQPFFNGKKLGNLKIPYSNKDEQKLIIKKLDKLTDLIEKLNDLNMLKKNKYSNFQKSILNKEFSYE